MRLSVRERRGKYLVEEGTSSRDEGTDHPEQRTMTREVGRARNAGRARVSTSRLDFPGVRQNGRRKDRTQEVGGSNLACDNWVASQKHRDKCRTNASDLAVTRAHRPDPCFPRALAKRVVRLMRVRFPPPPPSLRLYYQGFSLACAIGGTMTAPSKAPSGCADAWRNSASAVRRTNVF